MYTLVLPLCADDRGRLRELARLRAYDRLLVDHLPAIVVGLLDERLTWLALGGERLSEAGHDPGRAIGHIVAEGLPTAEAARVREFYEAALTNPQHRLVEADGRSLEVDALPLSGPDGQALVLSLSRDVTVRLAAEREAEQAKVALERTAAGFRAVFDSAPIGMALVSARPASFGRCLRANSALGRMLGSRPNGLVDAHIDDLTYQDDDPIDLDPAMAPDAVRRFERRLRHSSGPPIWVEAVYSLGTDEQDRPAFILQVEDLTARKASEMAWLDALEQQRSATEGLRELDSMRTELVATVSHELRTPLTAIGGHLELLADAAYGELTDDQRMMIGAANRNVERLASLIDDLLCLSRLDEPASVSPKERVDVGAAAQRTMDAVAGMVHRREQTVQVELPSTAAEILGDRVQLDLAIVNLLSNASKYSPAGGRIRLAVSQIDRRVVIEVSDNGMGIRSNERGQLFERFFRGADAGSRGIAGTGLGLAIVKQIVDRHGGVIDVTSTWGDGSTFRIELPAAS